MRRLTAEDEARIARGERMTMEEVEAEVVERVRRLLKSDRVKVTWSESIDDGESITVHVPAEVPA